jgi:hypothetical protein
MQLATMQLVPRHSRLSSVGTNVASRHGLQRACLRGSARPDAPAIPVMGLRRLSVVSDVSLRSAQVNDHRELGRRPIPADHPVPPFRGVIPWVPTIPVGMVHYEAGGNKPGAQDRRAKCAAARTCARLWAMRAPAPSRRQALSRSWSEQRRGELVLCQVRGEVVFGQLRATVPDTEWPRRAAHGDLVQPSRTELNSRALGGGRLGGAPRA